MHPVIQIYLRYCTSGVFEVGDMIETSFHPIELYAPLYRAGITIKYRRVDMNLFYVWRTQ